MGAIVSGEPGKPKAVVSILEDLSRKMGKRITLRHEPGLSLEEIVRNGGYERLGSVLDDEHLEQTLADWERQIGMTFESLPQHDVEVECFTLAAKPYDWEALMFEHRERGLRQISPALAFLYAQQVTRVEMPTVFPHAHVCDGDVRRLIILDSHSGRRTLEAGLCEFEHFLEVTEGKVLFVGIVE
jgi:hypothetical protein